MINRFRVQNYKALREVTLDLTPIHVLIGPNDSGKTSLLEAIAALCRSADYELTRAFAGSWEGHDLVWRLANDAIVTFEIASDVSLGYSLSCRFGRSGRSVVVEYEDVIQNGETDRFRNRNHRTTHLREARHAASTTQVDSLSLSRAVGELVAGVHYYRWVPRFLSLPNAPDARRRFRMEPSGFGLALCLDDILGYDREEFTLLEDAFRSFFPHFRSIKLLPQVAFKSQPEDPEQVPQLNRADGKGLFFQLQDGNLIPAAQVSDGVLLVLAYLAILHLPEPPRVLLIEEPENGIHPKRLSEVIQLLRQLVAKQDRTQVLLTTHSPYVVDLFRPEEVTLCRKLEDGSIGVRRLSESETVRRQIDVFTLGEIWTAEGDEALDRPIEPIGSAV